MTEPFIFGIPLIARAASDDWTTVETLLDLTLGSVLAHAPTRSDVVGSFAGLRPLLATGDGRFLDAQTGRQARAYAGDIALGAQAYVLLNEANIAVRDIETRRCCRSCC